MQVLKDTDHYKIYWYDDEQSIIIGEVFSGWTWQDADIGLAYFNEQIVEASEAKPIYAIIHLTTGAQIMPRGRSAITAIRNLLHQDPGKEKLTIFVTEVGIVKSFLNLATSLYGFREKIQKYHFVSTIGEALEIIENNRQSD